MLPPILGNLRRYRYAPDSHRLTLTFTSGLVLTLPDVRPDAYKAFSQHSDGAALERHFLEHLAPEELREGMAPPQPAVASREAIVVAEQGLNYLAPHLPEAAMPLLREIVLRETPCIIFGVAARSSKHGDHRVRSDRWEGLSEITVNLSGRPLQALITLLHEIAHAEVHRRFGDRFSSHGLAWRLAYQRLLHRALEAQIFPAPVAEAVRTHAIAPPSSSSLDHALQMALQGEHPDAPPLVSQLDPGAWFSLDGRLFLRRGPMLRSRIECIDAAGRRFRVSPTAPVKVIGLPDKTEGG